MSDRGPAGQAHMERADWRKIVFALADYAYRALGPAATWDEARVLVRAAIKIALDPETEDWDPGEETLLRHLGRTLRDIVFVKRDELGTGRAAREESPDWAMAARTYSAPDMRKRIAGPAGLPISNEEYFRARRRMRRHAIDVLNETRSEER